MKPDRYLLLPLLPLALAGYFLAEGWVKERRNEAKIVMLGDGHVAHFPQGKMPITFYGREEETTGSLLSRINAVADEKPKKLFLQVGYNDLKLRVAIDSILLNYGRIIARMKQLSPSTKIYVQSVLPGDRKELNQQVIALNGALQQLAGAQYVDVYAMVTSQGVINPYLLDGRYLNEEGYRLWRWRLRRYATQ